MWYSAGAGVVISDLPQGTLSVPPISTLNVAGVFFTCGGVDLWASAGYFNVYVLLGMFRYFGHKVFKFHPPIRRSFVGGALVVGESNRLEQRDQGSGLSLPQQGPSQWELYPDCHQG